MHHKAIKAEIRKQLKTQYPNWQSQTKKEKKAIAQKVSNEVVTFLLTTDIFSVFYMAVMPYQLNVVNFLNAWMQMALSICLYAENSLSKSLKQR